MKKGIVMEHRHTYTIVMDRDGTFHKAMPVKHVDIGNEIPFEIYRAERRGYIFLLRKVWQIPGRLIVLVCALLLFVLPIYFALANNKTLAYLSIDIKRSFELEVDNKFHVQSIRYLNEDAEQVGMKLSQYRDRKMETVIEKIMEQSEKSGLVGEKKDMLIGVSYPNKYHGENRLLRNLNAFSRKRDDSWSITAFHVPHYVRKSAEKAGKPTNEKLAEMINRAESSQNSTSALNLNDEEKAIIHSFYFEKNRLSEEK